MKSIPFDTPTDTSPCYNCPHHKAGVEKKVCMDICKPLASYQEGESYAGLPYPDITEIDKPEIKDRKICVICEDPEQEILNKRSQTCKRCYQRWMRGNVTHPLFGKFVPKRHKTIKEQTTIRRPSSIHLHLGKYPGLSDAIYDMVEKDSLPVQHVIISLISKGLQNAQKHEDSC